MRRNYFALFILVCAALVSCSTEGGKVSTSTYDTLYQPLYAKHFVVLQSGDTTILSVKNPWQGAKDISYDYSFYGTTPERIITMSTSHSAFLDALGFEESIVGVSGPAYLSNSHHQSLPDVGYGTSLNYETIVGLNSDLYTTYEVSGENSSATQKLQSLGVPIIFIADYLEDSPLAKAEWIVAFGAMMNKSKEAITLFEEIQQNYNTTKSQIAKRAQNQKAPKVIPNSPYKDVWYMPGDSSYMAELIRDAGGNYVGKGVANNISRPISMESAYTMLCTADIWLNPAADISSIKALEKVNPLLGKIKIPVFTNATNPSGGSDFWESGVLRCDIILEDLTEIFYSEDPELHYHKKLN